MDENLETYIDAIYSTLDILGTSDWYCLLTKSPISWSKCLEVRYREKIKNPQAFDI